MNIKETRPKNINNFMNVAKNHIIEIVCILLVVSLKEYTSPFCLSLGGLLYNIFWFSIIASTYLLYYFYQQTSIRRILLSIFVATCSLVIFGYLTPLPYSYMNIGYILQILIYWIIFIGLLYISYYVAIPRHISYIITGNFGKLYYSSSMIGAIMTIVVYVFLQGFLPSIGLEYDNNDEGFMYSNSMDLAIHGGCIYILYLVIQRVTYNVFNNLATKRLNIK